MKPFRIFVRGLEGEIIPFHINSDDLVEEFIVVVAATWRVPKTDYRLRKDGKILTEGTFDLYGVKEGSMLSFSKKTY